MKTIKTTTKSRLKGIIRSTANKLWMCSSIAVVLLLLSSGAYGQTKYISVTNPDGGDTFYPGETFTITWSPNWVGLEYVDIEMWKNGSFDHLIEVEYSTSSGNSYSFNSSSVVSVSSSTDDYQIKVFEVAESGGGGGFGGGLGGSGDLERTGVVGTSGNFNFMGDITVTRPDANDSYRDGDFISAQWNSNYSDPVEIELWRGSTKTHTLTTSTSNDGFYQWEVPTSGISTSSNYKVKIFDADDPNKLPMDESVSFTITRNTLSVTSGDNTSVTAGNNHTISWNSNLPGQVELHYEDAGGNWVSMGSTYASSGSKNWTTPSGSNYISSTRVRIRSMVYSHVVTYANNITLNKSITVTSPNSSTSKHEGQNLAINWDENYASGNVEIRLYKGGSMDRVIASSTSNDGSYSWTLPLDLATASNYQIRVQDTGGSPSDMSSNFDIEANQITASSGDNTTLTAGQDHTFSWSNNLISGYVDLHYEDGAGSWQPIATNVSRSTTSKTWTTPSGSNYVSSTRIRIKSTTDGGAVDYVNNITLNKSLTVTSPTSSTNKQEGQNLSITWNKNYAGGNVEIRLYKGGSVDRVIASSTSNDGSYSWTLPLDLATGSNYQVWVQDTGGAPTDISGNFDIEANQITVTGGSSSSIIAGQDHMFTWNNNLISGSVDLHYEDGSGSWQVIQTGVSPATTSKTWTTPSGGNYQPSTRVRIKSTADGGAVDYVDNITLTKSITISNPNGSSSWVPNSTKEIQWSTNFSENVEIELLKGGSLQQVITSSTANDGSYLWTVPQNLISGDNYAIRISPTSGGMSQLSSTFTIDYQDYMLVMTYNAYNDKGNPLQTTDAYGTTINYYYGDNDNTSFEQGTLNGTQGIYLTGISKIISGGSDSLTTSATYDSLGRMSSLTAENSVTSSFGYDGLNRLNEIKNDSGQTATTMFYEVVGSLISSTSPNMIRTTTYRSGDDSSRTQQYIDGLGRVVQNQQETDTGILVAGTSYDSQGRPWMAWKPYSSTNALGYIDSSGSQAQSYYNNETRPFVEQQYEPSPMNRVIKRIPEGGLPTGATVDTDYEVRPLTQGQETYYKVTTTTDEEGKKTETWTDGWGRTIRTVAAVGTTVEAITEFEYDLQDNLKKVKSPNFFDPPSGSVSTDWVTSYKYDDRGNVIQRTSPDAGTVKYKYNTAGNLRFSQDANRAAAGEVVFTTYDELGRPVAEGVASAIFDDLDGRGSYSFETANANIHGVYAYDTEPNSSVFPWNQFSSELSSVTLDNTTGQLTARAWRVDDGSSALIGSTPWQIELYSYNSEGFLKQKWVFTGNKSSWDYNLTYEYNRAGELIWKKIDIGGEVLYQHYTYNKRGLLAEVYLSPNNSYDHLNDNPEASYTYTATGAVENIDFKGSMDLNYRYTIRGWVDSLNNIGSPGGNFAAVYDYYDNGNVSIAKFHNPDTGPSGAQNQYDYSFDYDDLNRLKLADYSYPGDLNNSNAYDVRGLTYDANGNISSLQRWGEGSSSVDNLSYTYQDGTNRLNSLSDLDGEQFSWDAAPVASFGYDGNGNMTSQSGQFDSISYDHRNLPTFFDRSSGPDMRANYNGDGQRVLKEQTANSYSFYVMDGSLTLAVIEYDSVYQADIVSHVNLAGNRVFGRIETSAGAIDTTNARRYYISDHLGSTRAVVDNNGNVLETFDYYPFGLLMPGRTTTAGNTIEKFTGKERDEAIGLDYFGARYLDPALGRWHNPDPLAGDYPSLSSYNYAANNPLLFIDPDGRRIDPASQEEWEKQKQAVIERRNSLQAKIGRITARAMKKGWSAEKLDRKLGNLNERVSSLNSSVANFSVLENSEQVYSLQSGADEVGGTSYDPSTGNIVLSFGGTANFVHEATHAGQFETGDLAFDSKTGASYGQDLFDEVAAYKAQFGYSPSSVSGLSSSSVANSFGAITPNWVQGITTSTGVKPYSGHGLVPVNINSTRNTLMQAYPSAASQLKGLPSNFTLKSISTIIYKR